MNMKRILAISLAVFLMTSALLVVSVPRAHGDPVFKQIVGVVDQNPVTSVRAYDPNPLLNGWTYYYIQNRTNEGTGTDDMIEVVVPPTYDMYDPEVYIDFSDWQVGDQCINVINRDFGTYGVDHAGYVAFTNTTLSPTPGADSAPTTELQKIPTPTIDVTGVGFINMSWPSLTDPYGLIAGYTIYNSTDNGTVSGDAEWEPIGGSENSPITDIFYNASVTAGLDYYFAIKVVFTGYMNDNPGSVDNYECAYFGEGTPLVTAPVSLETTDYIVVEYQSNGTMVDTITIDVGQDTPTVIAQGYNSTSGNPTGLNVVDWTVDLPSLGSVSPLTGSSTIFTANFVGGTAVVTATNGTMTDIFNVTINPPNVDSIVLEYANGTAIEDYISYNLSMGVPLDIYAAGYNGSIPTFIGYQVVTWENITITGSGTLNVTSGDTVSYSGLTPGWVEIKGTFGPGVMDNFTAINEWGVPPEIDDIRITYANGTIIPSLTLDILQQYEVFAWGFNLSSGVPVNQVVANWESSLGGSVDPTGSSTNFTAGSAGTTVTVNATYMSLPQAQLTITINAPTVDTINITDSAGGLDLVSELISTAGTVTAYASGYNLTGTTYTFVSLVSVDWSINTTSYGDINQATGTSTTFTGSSSGMVLISADDGLGHTDNFTVEIRVFTLDYIEITDEFDGTPVDDIYLDVGGEITLYASGYNNTGAGIYTGPVDVTWTQAPNTIGAFSVASGNSTTFTAGMAADELYATTITGANTGLAVTDSFTLNINPPTIDYIEIRNATDDGGAAIDTDDFTLGETRLSQNYYCAGYNNTADYIGDVDTAAWTLDPDTGIGQVVPTAGTFTLFSIIGAGSVTLMANVSGITDSITITVNPLVDITPPAIPTGLTVTVGAAEKTLNLTWNANSDDAVGYNVYRSDSATGTFTKLNSALITDTSYSDTGLAYGTEYFYKITAVDNATNESPQSTAKSGTTAAEPDGDGDGDGDGDDGIPLVLLLLPIIIVVLVLLLLMYLMAKKKKPAEEAAPPEEEKKELPPPPGSKAEPEVEEVEEVEEEELPPPEDESEPAESEGETPEADEEEKPSEE
jgi:hypothetical protein